MRVPQRTIQIPIASDARHTQRTSTKHATLLGVACGYGQLRRGVEDGPASIRSAGLGAELRDLGYEVLEREDVKASPPTPDETHRRPRNVRSVLEACRLQSEAMSQAFDGGTMPITLGGDHSLSLGSWRAIQQRGRRTGLLWVDAHGDFNTPESSPSGNIHGMILSAIAGIGQNALTTFLDGVPRTRPEDIVLLGVRSLDPKERLLLRDAGVTTFTMKDIDTRGMIPVMEDALDVLTRGGQPFHVSFDVDAVDPAHAPGTGTPVSGGLSYRESRLLMELVFERGGLSSLDFSEVNPWLDRDGITSRLAVELIATALGRTIL